MISAGTKSVLWGVHAFWFHPFCVARAWRDLYGCWPKGLAEWLAVVFHDIGYLGLPNMDGPEGLRHPGHSSAFVWWGLRFINERTRSEASNLILGHSRHYSKKFGYPISKLYAADKLSIFYDPPWLYLLRATLSGEIWEYMRNAPSEEAQTPERWLYYYRDKVRMEFDIE